MSGGQRGDRRRTPAEQALGFSAWLIGAHGWGQSISTVTTASMTSAWNTSIGS